MHLSVIVMKAYEYSAINNLLELNELRVFPFSCLIYLCTVCFTHRLNEVCLGSRSLSSPTNLKIKIHPCSLCHVLHFLGRQELTVSREQFRNGRAS
jgi:hypothetical protein